jgi:hypothetical protein
VAAAATITADVLAGTTSCVVASGSAYTLTVVGDVTGGTGDLALGLFNNDAADIVITGNVTGGSGVAAVGMYNFSTGPVTITGNVTGGSGVDAVGMYNTTTGRVIITGNVTGGSAPNALGVINGTGGVVTIVHGNIINTAIASAVVGAIVYDPNEDGTNFVQYPGPVALYLPIFAFSEAELAAAVWAYGERTLTP